MTEGQSAAQVTPQAHPKTTADAGPDTVDAAANLANLAVVTESAAKPGSYNKSTSSTCEQLRQPAWPLERQPAGA